MSAPLQRPIGALDRYNPEHVKWAFQILARGPVAFMNSSGLREIKSWCGVEMVERLNIKPYTPGAHLDFVVAGWFDLRYGKIFPDNIVGKCFGCGTPIQWRPHSPAKPPKLCIFCAAERVAKEG